MPDRMAAWLTNDVLLLATDNDTGDAELQSDNGARLSVETHSLPLDDSVLHVLIFPKGVRRDRGWRSLSIDAFELTHEELEAAPLDLKTFLRAQLTSLSAGARNDVTSFVASAAGSAAKPTLSKALVTVRDVLRERLPIQDNTPDGPRGLVIDQILRVNDRSFYLKGWAHDEEAEIERLTAVSPEGSRIELLDKLYRYPRPDVIEWSSVFTTEAGEESGLICFIELDSSSLLPSPWIFEMENVDGIVVEVTGPRVLRAPAEVRSRILSDCADLRILHDRLMEDHISPAMTRLQEKAHSAIKIDKVTEYGPPPSSPDVSIVVPVYKNIDHLEGQLAEFADDPAMQDVDLVYVLDSPEAAEAFDYLASHVYPIYLVPFRIAYLEENVGFTGAINVGASIARGRLLLLLNSDVLPDRPGWLETMRDFYDSQADIGALAPKLLYEDDSIQHAGMHFYQPPGQEVWEDSQYYRGLHRTFPAANVARPVPAVTGACMMIERKLFDDLGGLSGNYVRGDYEDFDICLRLIERGRQNWYLPEAELYHLEAQSYTADLRQPSNRYNVWLHTHIWKDRLGDLLHGEANDLDARGNGNVAS